MKKTVSFALLWCLAAVPAGAISTCETRVDSHQNATTSERVAYCLTEEDVKAAPQNKPELIYLGVSSNEPQAEEKIRPTKNKNPYFREDKKTVAREYVVSEVFPDFKNNIPSEQERIALEKQQAAQAQTAEDYHVTGQKPARTDPAKAPKAQSAAETQNGLARRQTKPRRFMKETEETGTEQVAAEPSTQEPAPAEKEPAQTADPLEIPYGVQEQNPDLQGLPSAGTDPYSSIEESAISY